MGDNIPVMMSTLDVGDKVVIGLGVEDVGAAMQRFDWPDYIMFVAMLLICISIGLYYAFTNSSLNAQVYLVGGRTMDVVPVAFSLIASFVSGISLLGIPTEIYVYGIQYVYIIGGYLIMTLVMGSIYLPVFQGLKLTSTYEGGLKGVVWTDVFQIIIMFAAVILVVIKGTIDVGGIVNVIQRNMDSDRIEGPNFDLDPLARHTIWSLVFGGSVYFLQTTAINQNMMQRYLALPSLQSARRALWIFFFGMFFVVCLCSYCGMLIYAIFYKCDPLTTMLAREKDQLLPLLVMEILGDMPGLPGVFVAGIFGAALSSLSTGLNAMAAVVLEDFYKPFTKKQLSEKQTYLLMIFTVIIVGVICVGLVYVVEKLGAVLQLTMSIGAIASGPSLGIFTMGILLPWVNSKGALIGGTTSLIFMSWLCLRAQTLIASGDLTFPEKPVTTEGCHYHFTPKQYPSTNIHFDPSVNVTNVMHTDERIMIYRLSYLWYTLIGTFVTMFLGLLVSALTKPLNPCDVDPKLLAPFVRKLIKPRTHSNEQCDGIIYAYGPVQTNIVSGESTKVEIEMEKQNME